MASQPTSTHGAGRDEPAHAPVAGAPPGPPPSGTLRHRGVCAPALPPATSNFGRETAGGPGLDPATTAPSATRHAARAAEMSGAGCGAGAGSAVSSLSTHIRGTAGRVNAANRLPVSVVQLILSHLGDWHDLLQAGTVCRTWEYAFVHLPVSIRIRDRLTTWCVSPLPPCFLGRGLPAPPLHGCGLTSPPPPRPPPPAQAQGPARVGAPVPPPQVAVLGSHQRPRRVGG